MVVAARLMVGDDMSRTKKGSGGGGVIDPLLQICPVQHCWARPRDPTRTPLDDAKGQRVHSHENAVQRWFLFVACLFGGFLSCCFGRLFLLFFFWPLSSPAYWGTFLRPLP